MLLHQLLVDGAARTPHKVALNWVDRGRSLTYSEAVDASNHFAGALHQLGVRKGDRVTIFAHNGMDYVIGMFACWRIGAVAALVNVKLAKELEYYFNDHTPKVVIYTHDMADEVREAASKCSSIQTLVCMDGEQEGAEGLPGLLRAKFAPPPDPGDEKAIAHLAYTSGTSGKPKGACLAHEPTMTATRCIAERLRLTSDDVTFGPTALSSSYHLVANLLPGLHCGGTVNVLRFWTPASGWEKIDEVGATVLAANPPVLTELLVKSRKRGRAPSRLRMGVSGGGPVPTALKLAWRDDLKLPLVESYGQSELGGFFALGAPELQPDRRISVIGRPLPDKEVRILDETGREIAVGALGEICLRGGFMERYWERPEKTAEALREGWLHSGDAGLMDKDGYVTMRGRFSELIKVAGVTWFPRDVEDVLCELPGVLQACVIGLPDDKLGARPLGCVTLDEGAFFEEGTAKRDLASKVPYDLSSLRIKVMPCFPMTPTGKISKADLINELQLSPLNGPAL